MRSCRRALSTFASIAMLTGAGWAAPAGAASVQTAPEGADRIYDVTDPAYGAVGDGSTNDRAAIQAAIDDAAEADGGAVLLPAGRTFVSGNLKLKSNVTLNIAGTLEQSHDAADYTQTPVAGHDSPSGILWDHAFYQNLPLIYAGHQRNVAVVGDGTIQMTRAATEAATLHVLPIGFYRVSGFEIRDVSILGASTYNIALFSTDHGTVEGIDVQVARDGNTDGLSIQNSQDIRITGNTLQTGDDGIYVWSSYDDPRGHGTWWSTANSQPSRNIEIDHNIVKVTCCKAIALIAWGTADPTHQASISDVRVHHNDLQAGEAVGCWCNDPYFGENLSTDHVPISDVQFHDNVYRSPLNVTFGEAIATDLSTDFGAWSQSRLMNGAFDSWGDAYWTPTGDAGVSTFDAAVLDDPAARAAARKLAGGSSFGYIQGFEEASALVQGLGLIGADGGPGLRYTLEATVVTSGDPVRMFAYDTCSRQVVASRTVRPVEPTREQLTIELQSSCDNVHVGIDRGEARDGWALIEDVELVRPAIDSADPRARYTGAWSHWVRGGDWDGSHEVTNVKGAGVEVTFSGTRALLVGTEDYNLGVADVYVDGQLHGTADFYGATRLDRQVVYDTGELAPGEHTIEVVASGTRNPQSRGTYIVFDALLVAD